MSSALAGSLLEKMQAARDPETKQGTEHVHQNPEAYLQLLRQSGASGSGGALGRMPRICTRACAVKKAQCEAWARKLSGRGAATPSPEKSKLRRDLDRCTTVLEKSQKKGKDTQHGIRLCLDQEDGKEHTGKTRKSR